MQETRPDPHICSLGAINGAHQLGRDGEAALPTDGHTIESQEDSLLPYQTEQAGFAQAVMDKEIAFYAPIGEYGALVGERAIAGITNHDIGRDLSTKGREWTTSDLEVLNLEELALQPFIFLPDLLSGQRYRRFQQEEFVWFILSVWSVSFFWCGLGPQSSALSAEQLALLSQATITIDDLADGR